MAPGRMPKPPPIDVDDGQSAVVASTINNTAFDEDELDPARATCDVSKVLAVVRRKMEHTVRSRCPGLPALARRPNRRKLFSGLEF